VGAALADEASPSVHCGQWASRGGAKERVRRATSTATRMASVEAVHLGASEHFAARWCRNRPATGKVDRNATGTTAAPVARGAPFFHRHPWQRCRLRVRPTRFSCRGLLPGLGLFRRHAINGRNDAVFPTPPGPRRNRDCVRRKGSKWASRRSRRPRQPRHRWVSSTQTRVAIALFAPPPLRWAQPIGGALSQAGA
jgi:hypothetical protein